MTTKSLLRSSLSKEKIKLIIMGLTLTLTSLITVIIPYFNSMFLDRLIYNPEYSQIISLALFIVMIGLINISVNYFNKMCGIKLISAISFDLFLSVLKHMQLLPHEQYKRYDPTYLHQRISNESGNIVSFFINNYVSLFLQAITTITVFFIIYLINNTIFVLCIIFIPSYLISYVLIRKTLFKRNKIYKESQNVFFNNINDQFLNLKSVKTDVLFSESIIQSKNEFSKYFNEIKKFNRISNLFSSLDSFFSLIFQACVMIIGGNSVINKNMSIGEFNMILMYFGTFISCIKYYFNFGLSYQSFKASEYRLDELVSMKKEINGNKKIANLDKITLKSVSYSYYNSDLRFKYPDFIFRKGHIYCICGKNGAGKSTLIDLILGILTPLTGSIYYNNLPQHEVDLYELRKNQISVVLQNPYYGNITGLEFLSISNEQNYTISKVQEKIKELKLQNLFSEFDISKCLPKKLNQLSGGERQKILLLRSLIKDSSWIFLDEPSNYLDNQSLKCLISILDNQKKDKMILIVSHDILLQANADIIMTL